jgi:nucleoside-diphosphate-sugar epimerase
MARIALTGGSGFIGTNLVQLLAEGGHDPVNLDVAPPRNAAQAPYWRKVDIVDRDRLQREMESFAPEYVVHLAARTDLDGTDVSQYASNTTGTRNLLAAVARCQGVKKVVVTSSMLVCHAGYRPKDQFDFAPTTAYGESKVEAERIAWASPPACDWVLIRPTSIWGPWFGVPYRDFFDMLIQRRFVKFGRRAGTKTYGYVGNAVRQIVGLLFCDTAGQAQKVFYIGDYEPIDINEWADEIAGALGYRVPSVPYWVARVAAWSGDVLKLAGIRFPLTSFRLRNMTTDNVVDLSETRRLVGSAQIARKDGVAETLAWLGVRSVSPRA